MFFDNKEEYDTTGVVFNIEQYHVNDGSGIRTNVFLKGCNLWCQWCCNPESQSLQLQVAVHRNLCVKCGTCRSGVCPRDAITADDDGFPSIDGSKCVACGACVASCLQDAMELYGKTMNVNEAIEEVVKDAKFFAMSGGGLTIGGGEPCVQAGYAAALAKAARRRHINVAVETAGAVPFERLWSVAEHADQILFDVKYTDPEKFRTISDAPLDQVKGNLRGLASKGKDITMRCPIVPGLNDDDGHIGRLIEWARELGIENIDVLPFHQLGKYKYDSLGMDYTLSGLKDLDKSIANGIRDVMVEKGLNATVGG
ncbi:MAG: glycyl-radical enzyme activating protein [Clostridiales Family XIII bacterium]|jgi:pyruvate formate lyase activating enzyme|nr:glycyl-radical enzyme activating protein [Clostridiales Family XIII bacterium]